jgi:hypothetical protein
MDVVDYCLSLEHELGTWKQKLAGLRHLIEGLDDRQREALRPSLHDLTAFIERMSARIDGLSADCPTEAADDPTAPVRAADPAAKTAS